MSVTNRVADAAVWHKQIKPCFCGCSSLGSRVSGDYEERSLMRYGGRTIGFLRETPFSECPHYEKEAYTHLLGFLVAMPRTPR